MKRRFSLRAKIGFWFVALHLVLAAAAIVLLIERPILLFAVEALFVVSIVISVRLVRTLFVPLDLIRTGAELIAERDFTSRFVPVGQPEMDTLIDVYNRMIDRLRDERLASEERHYLLQKIVEASPSGIVILDFDGRVERANPAAWRLLGTNDARAVETELAEAGAGESKLLNRPGARRIRVTRSTFQDRGHAKNFFVIEELTEELRLTERAAYEKLIRMMSHEVNNSVGAVRSLLESLQRYAPAVGEADREDFSGALEVASGRMDALNRFMTSFADVVRIPPPRKVRASVAELVERVLSLFRPALAERRMLLESELRDRREYELDVAQIEQVIVNVLRNAMESAGKEGTLRVTLENGILTIADSGPGIASEHQSELFTPFFSTKRDGRGLGLTITQEILSNHGFPFALENRPEGGAEFRITFG